MTAAESSVPSRPVRVGISSCLLGDAVRYDGGHKRDAFLTDTFGRFVEWVPICPEMEAGFGTPREAMRLVGGPAGVRLLTVKTAVDLTSPMMAYVRHRVPELAAEGLSGYVLKKNSPSCGLERVKIYDRHDVPARTGRGLFAAALVDRYPHLPVEEEGRLCDPRLRENFVERVFAYWRLQNLFGSRWTPGALVRFHTVHKLTLMAHSVEAYRSLGRITASVRRISRPELERRYTAGFMTALAAVATRARHVNVLHHMLGYLRDRLDATSKTELLEAIEDYRRELVPLVVPITLMRHHVRVHRVDYLLGQHYLEPHPKELMLRNHV